MTELRQRQPVVTKPKRLSRAEKEAMEHFQLVVARLDRGVCAGTRAGFEHHCAGPNQAHHAIRQQDIRVHISTLDLTEEERIDWLWNPNIAFLLCPELHSAQTGRLRRAKPFRVPFQWVPARVVAHCRRRQVLHLLENEHPPQDAVCPACFGPITHPKGDHQ